MRTRSHRPVMFRSLAWVLAGVLSAVGVGMPSLARAELSGEVDAHGLVGLDHRYGGALSVDLWGTRGMFRPGAAFGIGALSQHGSATSRVFTPLSFALAFMPGGDRTGFVAVLHAGGYAGAQKGGLTGGAFFSGSMGLGVALGEGASLRFSAEAWGLIGPHGGVFFGPTVGLGF